jgi:BirA family biotin operon repressor/biotin-[acetyl-CoA-carboxylase] ligase
VTPLDIGGLRREFPDRRIDYYPSIDSTMRVAAALEPGAVVLAEEQRAGLGRHGHTWHSEAGSGIYCSLVLAPAPVLTLALGLAAQDAIAKSTGIACDLRWPNDVMIADRKVAGILVQLSGAKAIAGIGINVNHESFPPELASEATSLSREKCGAGASACQPVPREPIIAALLRAADEYLAYHRRPQSGRVPGSAPGRWNRYSDYCGRRTCCSLLTQATATSQSALLKAASCSANGGCAPSTSRPPMSGASCCTICFRR